MCVFNAYGKYNNAGWPGETDLKKKEKERCKKREEERI